MAGERFLYDVETNGLLHKATRMWILTLYDLDTGELESYLEGDFRWKQKLAKAKFLAGHNIVQFDNCILKKLFGFILPKDCGLLDTMIVSLVLNYRRFGENGHSLEVWGDHLGHPKVEHEDWSQYSEEMRHRNVEDVRLNVKVYEVLIQEYLALLEKEPLIHTYLKVEHAVAKWCGEAALHGWPFDVEKAKALKAALEVELNKAYNALSSKLGMKAVPRDKEGGEVAPKRMKWLKDGTFDKNMATFFGVDPMEGLLEPEERDVDFVGEFCRVNIVPLNLGYHEDVKLFLFRNGWVPTEWNFKKDKETGRPTKERSSPKITEDSLDILGGDGKLYPEFLTAKARHGILNTWLEEVDENGMLHGDCFTIGTPSMRARHSIIVNVPSSDAPWGKEMRELFMAKPGWKLLGCDSEGNQARGLAHFLNDDAFTDTLLNGDVHTFNANMLDQVLQGMGISWDGHIKEKSKYIVSNRHELAYIRRAGLTKDQYIERLLNSNRPHRNKRGRKFYAAVKRAAAKRILYAFLFGASGAKLWSYIFDTADFEQGNQLKKGFTKAVPGFTALLDKLARIFKSTSKYGDGYIVSIAGNRIYVDSFHKLLVYLLQSTEKITCGGACMLLMERLEERGIPYIPCIMMHDELVFMVPEEHAEEARQIGKQAFIDGPKLFGVEIMGGSGKIGNNWYEVH